MIYLDANVLYSLFGISKPHQQLYWVKGSSGSKIVDIAINFLTQLDNRQVQVIVSDLAVLEATGVAFRDIGPERAIQLLESILQQQGVSSDVRSVKRIILSDELLFRCVD